MFLLEAVAARLRLSQAKWWASAHSRSVAGESMPTKSDLVWKIDALATFSVSVRPRFATPLNCGVFADENSRLMPFFLQISANTVHELGRVVGADNSDLAGLTGISYVLQKLVWGSGF